MFKKIILALTLSLFSALCLAEVPTEIAKKPEGNDRFVTKEYAFGDWPVTCVFQKKTTTEGQPTEQLMLQNCAARKEFTQEGQETPMMYLGLTQEVIEGKVAPMPSIYMVLPLGVLLQPVGLRLDGSAEKTLGVPFQRCTAQGGCIAPFGFSEKTLPAFQAGNTLDILLILSPTQKEPIVYKQGLKGFTAATKFLKASAAFYGKDVTVAQVDALAK